MSRPSGYVPPPHSIQFNRLDSTGEGHAGPVVLQVGTRAYLITSALVHASKNRAHTTVDVNLTALDTGRTVFHTVDVPVDITPKDAPPWALLGAAIYHTIWRFDNHGDRFLQLETRL